VSGDQSGLLRDVLASHRTLLAYIRTALSFAGLGFVVAKFGLNPRQAHIAGYLGTLMVLAGLVLAIVGLAQHHVLLRKLEPTDSSTRAHVRWMHIAAGASSVAVCALLAVYLITSAT
jgi:uncharacterized membrane protein YidH (DUF202 family)